MDLLEHLRLEERAATLDYDLVEDQSQDQLDFNLTVSWQLC